MKEIKKLPENIEFLSPVFKENCVSVVFSASDYYAPYLAVALHSLVKNSSANHNYDIVVFTRDISEKNRELLQNTVKRENVSLRFYKMNDIFAGTDIYVPAHIDTVPLETYYRILAPYVLKAYSKSLFLDSDMLILSDVADLYNTDISAYALAASHEILFEASHIEAQYYALQHCGETKDLREKSIKLGKQSALSHVQANGVNETESYFQAGLILYNNDYFNKNHLVEKLFENIQMRDYVIVDQDALNEACYGHTLLLSNEWNFTPPQQGNFYKHMTPENRAKLDVIKMPKNLHFVGSGMKPWDFCTGVYHSLWWKYARETPFYETIISRNCIKQSGAKKNNDATAPMDILRLIKKIESFGKIKRRYWRYCLLKHVCFGRARLHYKLKKRETKRTLKEIKRLKREIGKI